MKFRPQKFNQFVKVVELFHYGIMAKTQGSLTKYCFLSTVSNFNLIHSFTYNNLVIPWPLYDVITDTCSKEDCSLRK
jgi:hypothetical protein